MTDCPSVRPFFRRPVLAGRSAPRLLALLALPLLAGCAASPASHAPDPASRAAVLAVMDHLFHAMQTRDTAAIRALAHPDLRIVVLSVEGEAAAEARVRSLDEFIAAVAAATDELDERAYEPEVRVDGPLATIWTYYDFMRGERFSHCGFDSFQLALGADGWRIIGLAYTARQQHCRGR